MAPLLFRFATAEEIVDGKRARVLVTDDAGNPAIIEGIVHFSSSSMDFHVTAEKVFEPYVRLGRTFSLRYANILTIVEEKPKRKAKERGKKKT